MLSLPRVVPSGLLPIPTVIWLTSSFLGGFAFTLAAVKLTFAHTASKVTTFLTSADVQTFATVVVLTRALSFTSPSLEIALAIGFTIALASALAVAVHVPVPQLLCHQCFP